jgi:hypothetical protein
MTKVPRLAIDDLILRRFRATLSKPYGELSAGQGDHLRRELSADKMMAQSCACNRIGGALSTNPVA